ncbi:hypothetical protein [Enterococcus sp. DIV0660C]|uniref:hypothetical protein n=1 Tax=Enterococcus sp. DIV0660C TaxID=2230880 RepID=UPI001A8FE63E|nr:hypothetical protein [Enterococcus sp. DIV0660C]MBO0431334.1 hypothetical protein [Enterococcus sp. DIV0660C]
MSYDETKQFIFQRTVDRLNKRMLDNGVKDVYEILGFTSKKDYEQSYRTWNDQVIKKILKGNIEKKGNRFLLTQNYAEFFKDALEFNTFHELYWGTNEEFDAYCQELFFCLLNDMKKDSNNAQIQEIVSSVLRFQTKESIYSAIKNEFHDSFWKFTQGEITVHNSKKYKKGFEKVGKKSKTSQNIYIHEANEIYVIDSETRRLGLMQGGSLSFKKIDSYLPKFANLVMIGELSQILISSL